VFRLKAGTSSSRHDTCRMRGRASAKHLDRFIVGVQPALNIEPFIERLGALPKPLDGNALPNLFEDRGARSRTLLRAARADGGESAAIRNTPAFARSRRH
jgi:hypothetical protein